MKVAVIVSPGVEPFGLGVLNDVWNEPHHVEDDNPVFDYTVCTTRPGRMSTGGGFDIVVDADLAAVEGADLVAVAAKRDYRAVDPAVNRALKDASDAGATILASCTAVFQLGAAGLLDGRNCTTHWRYGEELSAAFPLARVDTGVLYVEDGALVTGAGGAAGIDANLHLLRKLYGTVTATTAARRIVVAPHRAGGQAQFIRTPVRETNAASLSPLLAWIRANLAASLTVNELAARANLSARTFARRFRDETGTTPLQWVTLQRVALAADLLESSAFSVEQIATRCGFGSAAALRHHFALVHSTSPLEYRRSFACPQQLQR